MTSSTKRKTLILLGLVMTITVIIAASLSQLELRPGMPLPSIEHGQVVISPEEQERSAAFPVSELLKVLFALILAVSTFYVVYRMIRGIGWVNVGSYIQAIIVIILIAGSLIFLIMLLPKTQSSLLMEPPPPTQVPPVTSPLGPVPTLLFWLVGIALLVSSILLGIWIFAPSRRETTIDLVGLEAEKARQALMTGLDLKDVIIKCYRQMSLAVEKEQGIERKDFMTTREFESLLEATGMPHAPIHQLTQLFEAVRYGNWQPNPMDEQKAIHCLQAIVLYSRDTKKDD
ncbi:MAG TPA: DUF4129 domain-containing protein [Anaerolineales bacterium]|nr:DUF4129 domain-containing protein [Anaerolineales bacterium]